MPSGLVASLLGGADVPLDLSAKPLPLVVASIVGVLLVLYLRARRAVSQPPLINPKKRYELTTTRAREEFARNSRRILEQWFSENPAKPVTINTDMGLMTVLPSKMADEIRNDKRLGFVELTQQVCSTFGRPIESIHLRLYRRFTHTYLASKGFGRARKTAR